MSNGWIIGVATAFASSGVRITRVFVAAGGRSRGVTHGRGGHGSRGRVGMRVRVQETDLGVR